jgi:hypothetical protein
MPAASRLFGTTISYTRVVQCYSPALRPLSHSPLGLSLPCRPLNLSPSHQSSCPPGLRPPVQYSFQHPRLPSSSHAGVAPASRCRGIDSLRPWLLGHSWASRKRDHCRQAWFLKIDFRPIRTRAQSGFCAEHGGLYAGQSHPLLCRSRSFHLSPAPPRAGHFGENSRLPCPPWARGALPPAFAAGSCGGNSGLPAGVRHLPRKYTFCVNPPCAGL